MSATGGQGHREEDRGCPYCDCPTATQLKAEVERLRSALRALVDETPGSHPLYEASVEALFGSSSVSQGPEDAEE